MLCPRCKISMQTKYSMYGLFLECKNFEQCDMRIKCHPNGSPMGIPGNQKIRDLRSLVHEKLGYIFNHDNNKIYSWLDKNSNTKHFGQMNRGQLERILIKINGKKPKKRISAWEKKRQLKAQKKKIKQLSRFYNPETEKWEKITLNNYDQPTIPSTQHD